MDLRMETSQAVSMLQPFRHPKPGLIIMDKTKALKIEINAILYNVVRKKMILTATLRFVLMDKIEQYAQQVSREVAIEFTSNYLQVEKELIEPEFDEWKSNQEER